ncbi:alkaline phosphatase family protein [Nocardioides litoris]|uniref:alkaline phosphatase family protein n=1 Tax=Nocardioides litoris TaxID=1926648 RepID=UPI00111DDF0C|nr:alkaline phosphatase family protein [Nocardioides litoris]
MLPRSGSRRAPRALATLTALVTALGLAAGPGAEAAPAPTRGAGAVASASVAPAGATGVAEARKRKKRPAAQPLGPTVFQIASFNLLGSGHTDKNGPRKGFANSPQRLTLTKRVVDQEGLDLIGFQEMHDKQIDMWQKRHGRWWGLFPGRQVRYPAGHNSITWRKTMFDLVKAKTLDMPYFKGETYKMPYVLLRHRKTKQLLWVSNVHLPANTVGNAQRYRDEGIRRQAALVKRLRKHRPSVPVYLTGDMNDRAKFFCPMLAQAPLQAANGGSVVGSTCTPPSPMDVDWLLSTSGSTFSAFHARDDAIVDAASDHPFIIANATIPSLQARRSPVRQVVVVAVDGLRSSAIDPSSALPWFGYLRSRGTSTLNARTTPERSLPLPNLTSILTGRPVSTTIGGHGVATDVDSGGTVHQAAGRYVSSMFDMAHNNGYRTGFYSAEARSRVLARTWTEAGGLDPYGVDNGTNKLTYVGAGADDASSTAALVRDLGGSLPPAVSVLELGAPEEAGLAHGFESPEYAAAVRSTDTRIGAVIQTTTRAAALEGRTLVVVVGTSGGEGRSNATPTRYAQFRVPFLAVGPGVAEGKGLYALNPAWRDPKSTQGTYTNGSVQVGSVANLVLGALRLPALPGSSINPAQNLSVWKP